MNQLLLLLASLIGLALPSVAQGENHAKAALFARVEGDAVRVAVEIQIEAGWHLYSGPTMADVGPEGAFAQPTALDLEGGGIAFGDWRFPPAELEHQDFGTPIDVKIHRGTIAIYRTGTKGATARLEDLKLTINGQTCSDGEGGVCVPYKESIAFKGPGADKLFAAFPKDLGATAKSGAAPAATGTSAPTKGAGPTAGANEEEEAGRESSLLAFLISAVFWGLFTLLMPCTYPMIPITISYFTKQAEKRKSSTLPLSLAYGAGIVLVFILIGVLIGPLIIPFATHPITNIVIGGFFLLFALTLFGVMTLQPPAFLLNVAGSASQKGGYVGVFLMGATLVVTSFTCTAPFVGTLLSTGAASGGIGRIALGMGVFGLTMAIPFVFLSMVPAKVKAMPKSGEWMHTLKVYLGFVEVAAALKFISNADIQWQWGILSRELFLGLWAAIFFLAAGYLFAWIRLEDEYGQQDTATVSPKRMLVGFATVMFAMYCFYGMLGHRLDAGMTSLIPPYSQRIDTGGGATSAATQGHTIIEDEFDRTLEQARKEGKLMLVNFTGFV